MINSWSQFRENCNGVVKNVIRSTYQVQISLFNFLKGELKNCHNGLHPYAPQNVNNEGWQIHLDDDTFLKEVLHAYFNNVNES